MGSMTTATAPAMRDEAERLLRELAGPDARLREDQWTAIEALVVQRKRALVVQRTGWGKSAVYFISAKLLRATGHGPTVIVSPLLALMRNQVSSAERAGVRAATINSGNVTEWDDIHARVAANDRSSSRSKSGADSSDSEASSVGSIISSSCEDSDSVGSAFIRSPPL